MLKIRKLQLKDTPLVANLIRKSPTRGFVNPNQKTEFYWRTNVYKEGYTPSYKILRRTRYLEKIVGKKSMRNNYLVIEDNNKIVGVVQKSGSKFANLYLDERYARTGKTNQIINHIESNLTKKIGGKTNLKLPVSPSTILVKRPFQKQVSPKPVNLIKISPYKINK